jgi:hypothetical protein
MTFKKALYGKLQPTETKEIVIYPKIWTACLPLILELICFTIQGHFFACVGCLDVGNA